MTPYASLLLLSLDPMTVSDMAGSGVLVRDRAFLLTAALPLSDHDNSAPAHPLAASFDTPPPLSQSKIWMLRVYV